MPRSGGSPTRLAEEGKDRVLFGVITPHEFDYKAAIADGPRVTLVPVDRQGDTLVPGWTPEGDIIAVHELLRSELWRFGLAAK